MKAPIHHEILFKTDGGYTQFIGDMLPLTWEERTEPLLQLKHHSPGTAHLYIHVLLWDQWGRPVYVLPWHISDAFSNIRLDNVKSEDIQAPFNTVYISLPDSSLELHTTYTGPTVTGTYVTDSKRTQKVIGAYLTVNENEIVLNVVAMKNPDKYVLGDDSNFYMEIPRAVFDEEGIENYLGAWEKMTEVSNRGQGDESDDQRERNQKMALQVMRICINMCMYLRTRGAKSCTFDPTKSRTELKKRIRRRRKNPQDAEDARKALRQTPERPVIFIGTKHPKALPKRTQLGKKVTGKKLKVHWRSGYWKWVPYGPLKDASGKKVANRPKRLVLIPPVVVNAHLLNEGDSVPRAKRYEVNPEINPFGEVIV